MVYSPGGAGIVLVWQRYRLKGLLSLFRARSTLWRAPGHGVCFLILVIPLMHLCWSGHVEGTRLRTSHFTP